MEPSSYASEKKGKNGIKRIINAFGYSKDGLAAAYRYESAFRQVFLVEPDFNFFGFVP